jgi:type II secretory pathway pseudopilin PulG
MKKLSIKGDTIIEVLLAIAIVSLVLSGAYASARRSLVITQQNQERGEAIKLVEQQLERLKTKSSDPTKAIFAPGLTGPYHIVDNGTIVPGEGGFGIGNRYVIGITRKDSAGTYIFVVRGHWNRFGDNAESEMTMYYRVYPDL